MKKGLVNIALLMTLAGCQQSTPPAATSSPQPAGTPALSATATPVATETAAPTAPGAQVDTSAMLAQLEGDKFPYPEIKKKENGPIFLAIASNSQDNKAVVAALKAVVQTYSSREGSEKRNFAGDDYKAMIAKNLKSDDPAVRHWAIKASSNALGENPAPEVLDQLVAFMTDETAVEGQRVDAIDELNGMKDYTKNEKVADALYQALSDKHPAVISEALFRLSNKSYAITDKEKFLNKAIELTEHSDPGVRGRATDLVGKLGRGSEDKVKPVLKKGLKDSHPYVRSEAVSGLAFLKITDAIPDMMPLLDDSEKNTYNLSFKNLLGQNDSVHHDGSAWSRVDDAVLRGLQSMTFMTKDKKFEYGKIEPKTKDADIAREVGRAKQWYEKNKGSL